MARKILPFEDLLDTILNKLISDIEYHTKIILNETESMFKSSDVANIAQLRESVHISRKHLDKLNESLKEMEKRWIY